MGRRVGLEKGPVAEEVAPPKNNTKVYLIKWHQVARVSSIEQGLAPLKQ